MTLTLHVGASGMGKTHALARVSEAYAARGWTVLIADHKREMGVHLKRGARVSSAESADKARTAGHRLLVWESPAKIGDILDIDALCAYALNLGRGVLVAVPEAHLHWPLGPRPPAASVEMLTGYRHRDCALILDTQRLVHLSMMARNNLDLARIFGTVGPRDLSELGEWGGPALADAARECARRRRQGQPGWFAAYDPAGGGPGPDGTYPLARMPK